MDDEKEKPVMQETLHLHYPLKKITCGIGGTFDFVSQIFQQRHCGIDLKREIAMFDMVSSKQMIMLGTPSS